MSAVDDGPSYEKEKEQPALRINTHYNHVKVGQYLHRIAVIEVNSGEAIQFLPQDASSVYAEHLLQRWESHFSDLRRKVAAK